MKIRLFSVLALAGLLFCGCVVEDIPAVEGGTILAEIENDLTRTSVTDEGSFTWSAGDKVWLHTTGGGIVGTLSSGAGTSSAQFAYGAFFGDMTGKAIYPYNSGHSVSEDQVSVVLPASYDLGSTLSNTNAAMYGEVAGGTIKFNHLAGVMRFVFKNVPAGTNKFQLTLDKKINGTFIADLDADYPVLETSATSTASEKTVTLNFDALTTTSDISLYVPLPVGTYTSLGLDLWAGSKSVWSYSNAVTNTISRKTLKLMPAVSMGGSIGGDIEGRESVNLSENGTANSYIISAAGSYKFTPVKGNSAEAVGAIASAEVLWETFGTDVTPVVGDLVKNVKYTDGVIRFETPSAFKEGNAVIAAKDASGKILWSWHIWLTDEPKGQEYHNNAGTMMDRNLGATSATPGDVGALGLLYQWGRKDPFLGSSSITNSIEAKSTITWPSAGYSNSSNGTIDYAIEHPTTFIKINYSNSDWYYTGTSTSDNTRWTTSNRKKSIYDPCPVGWRIPDGGDDGVWSRALDVSSISLDHIYDSANNGYEASGYLGTDNLIWYPKAGYRHDTDGTICNNRDFDYWTSSSFNEYTSYRLSRGNSFRATANSVRCVREETMEPDSEREYVDEYGINHGRGISVGGTFWAPVNCGYHETDYPYGKLYQWGRKYGQGYNGTIYDENGNLAEYSDAGVTQLYWAFVDLNTGQSKSNQNTFFRSDLQPYNWYEYLDDYLWNSGSELYPEKAEFDPCPYGWRVPTSAELTELVQNFAWGQNDDSQFGAFASGANSYSPSAPHVFLPATGIRNYVDGEASGRGRTGFYWFSTPSDGFDIPCLIFHKDGINLYNFKRRACALAVRCVADNKF